MARAVASRSHCSAQTASLQTTSAALRASMSSASSDSSPAALSSRASIAASRSESSRARCSNAAAATGSRMSAHGAERAAQGPGDGLHRGSGGAEHAGVAVGVALGELRQHRVELRQERRRLGRRAIGGAPHHGDDSAHRTASVGTPGPGAGAPPITPSDGGPARGLSIPHGALI